MTFSVAFHAETDTLESNSGLGKIGTITVACSVLLVALVTLAVIITLIKVLHHRAKQRRSRQHMTFKISPVNSFHHQKIPSISPGDVDLRCMEFSRGDLELHKQIGETGY